jgi:FkbM family methyltransferase
VIGALGRAAAAARKAGLGSALRGVVAASDAVLLRASAPPPLRARVDGAVVRGYLRHRSFLAEAERPRATYVELFRRLLRPGMTVIDGGAHVGLYSVLAARGVGADGVVFAVEPDAYNLAALRANVAALGNVRVVAEALTDRRGTTVFYETPSTIGSSILARPGARPREVATTSIDDLLANGAGAPLLVKLNIEGAEELALAGMHATFERIDEILLLVEVNPPLSAAAATDLDALFARLRDRGFAVEYVDLPTQTLAPLPSPLRKGHVLASRTARP